MRRDVLELREFYASPAGAVARAMIGRKLEEAWGDCRGLDVLGLGYATPFIADLPLARRAVAAMPAAQGVEIWPGNAPTRACLVDEGRLPFPNALFDRVLVVHGLEEAPDAQGLLAEAGRVLAPSGRLIVAVAARGGLWSKEEKTPFGHGRPFTRRQLEQLLREAELEPTAWSYGLYAPPWKPFLNWAEAFEQVGSRVWPGSAGVILIEAVKRAFAVKPRGKAVRIVLPAPGDLVPRPVPQPAATRPVERRRPREG